MTDVLERPPETASGAAGSATDPSPAREESWTCPECGRSSPSETGLKIHWKIKHRELPEPQWTEKPRKLEGSPRPAAAAADAEAPAPARSAAELEAIRKKTVESLQTLGGWAFVVGLQVTGVAVSNRAERLSWQAIAYAQRDERFLKALEAFNEVMSAGELAKIGSELGMAVGVDLGVLHPARPVRFGPINVPGFVFLQPLERDLREVAQIQIQAEALQREHERQTAAARAAENGVRPQDAAAGQ